MNLTTLDQAILKYGAIEGGVWPKAQQFCELITVPDPVASILINSASRTHTGHIYCNKDMAQALLDAFTLVINRNLLEHLETYDGCWNIRDTRGEPGKLSTHAYALAIDLNAKTNPLGVAPTMNQGIVQCFEDCGFIWGGRFKRNDGMHFQFAAW